MHRLMKPFLITNQKNRIKYQGGQWNYNTDHKEKNKWKAEKVNKSHIIYILKISAPGDLTQIGHFTLNCETVNSEFSSHQVMLVTKWYINWFLMRDLFFLLKKIVDKAIWTHCREFLLKC